MSGLKSVIINHRRFFFGRRKPASPGPRLYLRNYLDRASLPPIPASCDYSSRALPSLRNVYLNDVYGDCVIAGGAHLFGTLTGNASGDPILFSNDQVLAQYAAIGGFDPNNPSQTDNGCDEKTALEYWTNQGFAGHTILGWLSIDPTNPAEYKAAMFLFENLFYGAAMPNEWIDPPPQGDGFVWDAVGRPNQENGHCFLGVGHDAGGVKIATWGLLGTMTDRAHAVILGNGQGELYSVISRDQLANGMTKAPNGVDWDALLADFKALGGNLPTPPTPIPPAPTPPAPSAISLKLSLSSPLAAGDYSFSSVDKGYF